MIAEVENLMDHYLAWLRDRTVLREVGAYVEVTTPFLDRHNDCLQLYMRRDNGHWQLSDDGHTLRDLALSGCNISGHKRQELLRITLNGFGVTNENDVLTVKASTDNFPARKHNLVQAMLAVNDLFYVAQANVVNLFKEDVTAWLDAHDIRYAPRIKLTGRSGFDHLFDYVIPKSKYQPERIVQAVATPTKQAAELLAFMWSDTAGTRPADAQGVAILNDEDKAPPSGVIAALEAYGVRPVRWSERETVREALAA